MTSSLTISGQIDAKILTVFETVSQAAHDLGIPYVVVGATARDLVLHHVYGAKVQRATTDVDFGFQVSDWNHFNAMKRRLSELGFNRTSFR